MGSLGGTFNAGRILSKVAASVYRKRMMTIVNPSNSNGSAFLESLGLLRIPANKRVLFRKASVASPGISVGERHRGVKVMFRRFGLFPRGAMGRGVVLTPMRLGLVAGSRTSGGTSRLLTHMNLPSGTGTCPSVLSNKRGRHVTVTHSLTVGPSIVLFSRPASTLSPRVMNRILRLVGRLTRSNVAVIMIARRVKFTERITAEILFVSSNGVRRRGAPGRFFTGPGGPELGSFLSGILWSTRGVWRFCEGVSNPNSASLSIAKNILS